MRASDNEIGDEAAPTPPLVHGRPIDLQLDWRFLACLALPLLVFAAARVLQTEFWGETLTVFDKTAQATPLINSRELTARFLWMSSELFYWAVCLTALGYFLFSHHRFLTGPAQSWAWTAIISVLVLTTALLMGEGTAPYHFFGKDLFSKTVGEAMFGVGQGGQFDTLIKFLNAIAAAAPAFVVIGAASLTGRDRVHDDDTMERKIRVLARQIAELRVYLYIGAALLLSGMVVMKLFFLWPLPFIEGEDQREAFQALVQSLVTYAGVSHVLVLAATFGPPLLYLNYRGRALADEALGIVELDARRDWRLKRGLVASLPGQALELVAIMSPLLASPIGSVIGKLAG